jgi:hypothetical protein
MTSIGKYPDYQALAKLEYGRLLWKSDKGRQMLLSNWTHPQHPHQARFEEVRQTVERILESSLDYEELDKKLRQEGASLRTFVREIPGFFPSLAS